MGGHAAALSEENLEGVMEFVLTGAPAPAPTLVPEPSKAFAFISRLCTYLPLIVLVSAVAVLAWFGVLPESFRLPATIAAALVTAYGVIKSV